MKVFDNPSVIRQVKKYNVKKQYRKSCFYIEKGFYGLVDLKLRKPKHLGIYQFRITRKYRAFAIKEDNNLVVFKISDHQ